MARNTVNSNVSKTVNLTNALADKMPLPVKTPRKGKEPRYNTVEWNDAKVTGLVLRALPSGKKTWFVRYRTTLSRVARRMMIGSYPLMGVPKARSEATKILGSVANGQDPAYEKKSIVKAGTLAEYSQLYTKALLPSKSSET